MPTRTVSEVLSEALPVPIRMRVVVPSVTVQAVSALAARAARMWPDLAVLEGQEVPIWALSIGQVSLDVDAGPLAGVCTGVSVGHVELLDRLTAAEPEVPVLALLSRNRHEALAPLDLPGAHFIPLWLPRSMSWLGLRSFSLKGGLRLPTDPDMPPLLPPASRLRRASEPPIFRPWDSAADVSMVLSGLEVRGAGSAAPLVAGGEETEASLRIAASPMEVEVSAALRHACLEVGSTLEAVEAAVGMVAAVKRWSVTRSSHLEVSPGFTFQASDLYGPPIQ